MAWAKPPVTVCISMFSPRRSFESSRGTIHAVPWVMSMAVASAQDRHGGMRTTRFHRTRCLAGDRVRCQPCLGQVGLRCCTLCPIDSSSTRLEIKAECSRLGFHKASHKFRFERGCRRSTPRSGRHMGDQAGLDLVQVCGTAWVLLCRRIPRCYSLQSWARM